MTAFTGVFPCHKNQFKAGATGTTNAISDMGSSAASYGAAGCYPISATSAGIQVLRNTSSSSTTYCSAHDEADCVDYDLEYWRKIDRIRNDLGRDTLSDICLLTKIVRALEKENYKTASRLQVIMQEQVEELVALYSTYKKNLF